MTTLNKLYADTDKYLMKYWFDEYKRTCYNYMEPMLDSETVALVKSISDSLKQDSNVFIMSVDLLVQYITIQNNKYVLIRDQLLVIICIVSIIAKNVGNASEIKPKSLGELYRKLTNEEMTCREINLEERDILQTLNCNLPLFSKLDDLTIFLVSYLKHFTLPINIMKLCIQILDITYIYYKRLFFKLKSIYKQNPEALQAFKDMITHRMYLPCGIFLCGLEITKTKHFMDTKAVLLEISEMCEIHNNHLELLAEYIQDIIEASGFSVDHNV